MQSSSVVNNKLIISYMVSASDTLSIYDLGLHSATDTLAILLHKVALPGLGTVSTHSDSK